MNQKIFQFKKGHKRVAKIVLTIEDVVGGKVRVVSEPSFESMMKMNASGEDLTAAHGYALVAINQIRRVAKEQDSSTLIKIPRLTKSPY
jgi:hypothetical protein